ncbi:MULTISPECIES: hypothetical protein [Bacillus]|uniref:Uncharacterized protein n=1 Tax=Bacillus capparidis TaxID=1840411 RepID=A0ABS4CVA9_9BACI|nr:MULTISPECIES: hypothetical protein [Bacillus]MBP1081513.1 hypothetical protein [Bacillus capparidis]MED1096180.1 hypothetical protein [Bacillus capparidis]
MITKKRIIILTLAITIIVGTIIAYSHQSELATDRNIGALEKNNSYAE